MANEQVDIKVLIDASQSAKTLADMNSALDKMKEKLKTLDVGSKEFKELNKAISEADKNLQSASNSGGLLATVFPNLAKGLDLIKKGTTAWGAALKAAGIGLIVSLVALLVEGFKKLEPVMTLIEGITNSISNAFASLINLDIGAFFDNITGAGVKAAFAQKELEKETAALAKTQATLNGEIEYQEKLADDTTKSAEERKKALDAALAANKKLAEAEEANNIKNIAYLKEQVRLTGNSTEAVKALAEAEAKQLEDRSKARTKDADLTVKINGINKEEADKVEEARKEAEKKAEEARKKALESEKDYQKRIRKLREENELASIQDDFAREKRKLEFQRQAAIDEINLLTITEAKKRSLREQSEIQYQNNLKAVQKKADDEAEAKRKANEAKLMASNKQLQDMLHANEFASKQYFNSLNEDATEVALNAFKLSQDELDYQRQKEISELEQDENYGAKANAIYYKYAVQKMQIDKAEADYKKELEKQKRDASIAMAASVLGAVSGFLEEGSDAAKGVAVAQTLISTYQGAQAAFASASAVPVIGSTLAPIAAAAAVAAGLANVRKIVATKPSENGSSGGSAAAPVPAPIAPKLAMTGGVNSDINVRQQSGQQGTDIQQIQQQSSDPNRPTTVVKAIVVESEVTGVQKTISRIKDNATIG